MCGGGKTKTSTSSTTALPQYADAYSNILNQAQGVANTPWNPATGQNVAGFSNPQNQAFDLTQSNLGSWQPYLNTAGTNAASGSAPISASDIQRYMDPYTQNVVNATTAQFANQNAQQLQSANANAAKIGALTGDRSQVAQSVLQGQQALAQNPIISGLYSQGYTQALGAAQNDATRALQGAQINSNLANQTQQLGQNDVASLWGAGQAQQQQQQNIYNANTANAQAQAQYPFATTQWLSSLATGLGGAAGTQGSQTQPGPNMWSQVLGAGLAGASLLSDERAKEDIQEVGRLHDGQPVYSYRYSGRPETQIGLLAQDVEQSHPEAVGEYGGLKTVDYRAATRNAAGRMGYDSGGSVLPYAGAPSYVPSSGISHGGMNHSGSMPSLGDNTMSSGMSDVLNNFKQAKSAFQGAGDLGTKAWNYANTTTDPNSGWSTTTTPSGMSGLSNFLSSTFGFADGGSVRRGFEQGGVPGNDDIPFGAWDQPSPLGTEDNAWAPSIIRGSGNDDIPFGSWNEPSPIGTEDDRWAPSITPEPAMAEPSYVGGPPPAQEQAARSGPVAEGYVLPQSEGFLGLKLSDPVRQGLLAAGLGMMASESPFIGTAIGEGGLAGIKQYGNSKQQQIDNAQTKTRIDQEAQRLAQAAKEASERMRIASLQEGRAAEAFPLQQAQIRQTMDIQNRPEIKVIGQDDFGRNLYGLVDPRTGQPSAVVDQNGSLMPVGGSGAPVQGSDGATPSQPGAAPPGRARMTDLVDGIMSGKQPPVLTGLYKNAGPVRAALAQRGFDLATAQLQWDGAHKQVMSMNGPQQVRYYQLANGVVNTIDRVNELARDLQNSGVPLLNKVKLDAYIQTNGNSPQGQLATQYVTAVGVLREEMANLANGGYAPTEPAWALANEQVNGNYGVHQLGASLTELQRLINYRLRALPQANTLGPGAANPYTGATGKQPTHDEIDAAVKASQPDKHTAQAADGDPPLARPKTKPEYDALSSGTRYIDPKGEVRTKP